MSETIKDGEKDLLADIERLRAEYPKTQDLYREVSALMFFRYGTTPTANKLYQLVRKGSMSAPAEALNQFWLRLRENSRTTIEHPDLPEELKSATGELAATLWKVAQACATGSLAAFREDAQSQIECAKLDRASALTERDALLVSRQKDQQAIAAAEDRILSVQNQLSNAQASIEDLRRQLAQATTANQTFMARLDEAHQERVTFTEKVRQDERQAEERRDAMHKHALQEIDRERQTAIRLEKMLDSEKAAGTRQVEALRASEQHGALLEGRIKDANAAIAAASTQVDALRRDSMEARMALAAQERETAMFTKQLSLAQASVEKLAAEKLTWMRERIELEGIVRESEHRLKAMSAEPDVAQLDQEPDSKPPA
jgi:chromosome segregation ATPase